MITRRKSIFLILMILIVITFSGCKDELRPEEEIVTLHTPFEKYGFEGIRIQNMNTFGLEFIGSNHDELKLTVEVNDDNWDDYRTSYINKMIDYLKSVSDDGKLIVYNDESDETFEIEDDFHFEKVYMTPGGVTFYLVKDGDNFQINFFTYPLSPEKDCYKVTIINLSEED